MQEGLDKRISYEWIEIAPMLVLLILVIVALAIIPNCIDRESCVQYPVNPNIDIEKLSEGLDTLENVFNKTHVEIP